MTQVIPVLSRIPNMLKELRRILPDIHFHEVSTPEKDPLLQESEICIMDFDILGRHLYNLPNAKWVQGTWAGVDFLMKNVEPGREPPGYMITRFTGQHFGLIMGEFVVAMMVNHERNLYGLREHQRNQSWAKTGLFYTHRAIFDLTVGVLGTGNIGKRVGKILSVLGAKVNMFGRRPELPSDNDYSFLNQYYTKETLPELLAECDYIINVLPDTPETRGLLNGDILKHSKGGVFINIGRGTVVAEKYLIRAINNKWLSAAILDVFDPEPLPKDSPLWKMQEVTITPHIAGNSRAKDIAEQFRDNLQLYNAEQPLPALLDITKGY